MDPADKKKRATYQDVLDAPEHEVAEIVNGELHISPRPFAPHTAVASVLGGELYQPFQRGRGGPGGWIILDEPELHLGEDVLVPDLAGWRVERMPVLPEEHFSLPPDWVCEVLSKSTERLDRIQKMPIYASAGVQYAWLVSPKLRTLEASRLVDGRWTTIGLYKETDRAHIEPFDAIELDLALLWNNIPLPTRASEGAAQYDIW
jgi:Uma2 family endonuclease